MIRVLLVLILAGLAPYSIASAQSRDLYTVRGIEVDETAPGVIEAREAAFSTARLLGAKEMLERITLPEDRIKVLSVELTEETANLLAVAVDVEEEVAGAGRYRGRLSVVFNPANVRAFLDTNDIPYTDQPAPLAVVFPVASFAREAAWNSAWGDNSVGHLAPTVTSRSFGITAESLWEDVSADIALYGGRRGVIAELIGAPGSFRVTVSTITPSGVDELGTTARVGSMNEAVLVTNDLLDDVWKEGSVIRDSTRTLIEATVSYTSLAEWNTLRGALARSPLVSDFQTKAVSRDGAVVAFVFAGNGERLVSDLRNRGVEIQAEDIGWVLSSAISPVR